MSINYYDYIHNNSQKSAFETTDNNGIIFEFTAAIASNTFTAQPNYLANNLGFSDVSAIATIDIVPSDLDNLFYFQTGTSLNLLNIIKYGINTQFKFNLNYSSSFVTCGNININGQQQTMHDYINYLSYAITNLNINASSVFSNYDTLVQGVQNMDASFNSTLNNNFTSQNLQNGIVFFNDTSVLLQDFMELNPYVISSKQLVDGMKYIATGVRKDIFLNDISKQVNNQNIYWIPFHIRDKISIVIKYVPSNGNGNPIMGPNPVYTRSYKIVLNCVYAILPDNMAHIAYNGQGNLDPMHIVNLLNQINQMNQMNENTYLDASFIQNFNNYGLTNIKYKGDDPTISEFISLYKQIGYIINPVDFYFKTLMSGITQPSIINDGIFNNGLNYSFQYILLNSTITTLTLPSLRTIKESLLTSPCEFYPILSHIQNIKCDLNCVNSSNFIIRIYTRPIYTGIDNIFNPNDTFYGNYYDSVLFNGSFDFTTYNLHELFPYWSVLINSQYTINAYYYNKGFNLRQINTFGEQQILSICIFNPVLNSNIGIKNIELSYI